MNSSAMYMYGLPNTMYADDTLSTLCTPKQEANSFTSSSQHNFHGGYTNSTSFSDEIYVPNEVVEELEWLSNFMEDSTPYHSTVAISHHQINQVGPTFIGNTSGYKRSKTKSTLSRKGEEEIMAVQRCTHCAAEKTPQWRTGPQGPKTLCNACGVRYKSGRLVPEYRPANSPTFVQSQHSNSHRKVMELRRQKEHRLTILG